MSLEVCELKEKKLNGTQHSRAFDIITTNITWDKSHEERASNNNHRDLRGNIMCTRNLLLPIRVYFRKGDHIGSRQLLRELFVKRRNLFAWPAPIRVEVNHHNLRRRKE